MAEGGLKAWTDFLLKAVREGGTLTVIHRADRLGDLLALLRPRPAPSASARSIPSRTSRQARSAAQR